MSAEPSSGVAASPDGGDAPSGMQPSLSGAESTPSAQPASSGTESTPSGAQPIPNDAPPALSGGVVVMRIIGGFGALLGYGCLAAFLLLIGSQIYRWFRDGEWSHFGVVEGMRVGLTRCCVNDGDTGRLAALVHWLDAPVDWLGLHKVLEILPASLALFALSILGNSVFLYCLDQSDARRSAETD
jgi:hypothetical protein